MLLPRKQNPRTQQILALNPNFFSPKSSDPLFSQVQEYAGYLPIASQFQIHPFYTLSALLGVGFWKLYFPGFFGFPSVSPATWQQQGGAEGRRKEYVPSFLFIAQHWWFVLVAAAGSDLSLVAFQRSQNRPPGPRRGASGS